MQKYKSNITTTSGAAVRGVPVLVIDEDGNNAALFLDRAGTVPAPNPLTTGPDGVFYFYAVNGRYSLRTTVDGVTITDDDVVLMMDPEEITVAGPIAEAVAAAQAAATAAEFAVEASGIPDLVAAAQNAVVDSNNAVTQANSAANNAAISKTGADSARDAAVIAKNAAEAALDSFDDHYLGAKATAPTLDNDGAALLTGALYWDTALQGMRSWNGGAWVTLPAATKASVGLANVDNTSDANKPVSTATQAALTSHTGNTSNPHGVTKVQVGLGNVDNTADANKPVSTAQSAAIAASTANNIHGAAAKITPADADEIGLSDSAAAWGLKKLTFANLKAWLASLFVSKTGATMTGDLTVPSLNGGQLAGMRNRLINGDMRVNQRGFSGVWADISDGAYGYDRWKRSGLANKAQIVEAGNFKPSTVHTLSGVGVTTSQVTSPASGNWAIIVPASATNVMLEEGGVATPFENRPYGLELALCQRYYEEVAYRGDTAIASAAIFSSVFIAYKATKRTLPTLRHKELNVNNCVFNSFQLASVQGCTATYNTGSAAGFANSTLVADAEL